MGMGAKDQGKGGAANGAGSDSVHGQNGAASQAKDSKDEDETSVGVWVAVGCGAAVAVAGVAAGAVFAAKTYAAKQTVNGDVAELLAEGDEEKMVAV